MGCSVSQLISALDEQLQDQLQQEEEQQEEEGVEQVSWVQYGQQSTDEAYAGVGGAVAYTTKTRQELQQRQQQQEYRHNDVEVHRTCTSVELLQEWHLRRRGC